MTFYVFYQVINIIMIAIVFFMAWRLYNHLDRYENRALFILVTGLVLDIIGQFSISHSDTVEAAAVGLRLSISGQAVFGLGFVLYITKMFEVKHKNLIMSAWLISVFGAFAHAFMLGTEKHFLANPYIVKVAGVSALVGQRKEIYYINICGSALLSIWASVVALRSLMMNSKRHNKHFRYMVVVYIVIIAIHHTVANVFEYQFMRLPDMTALFRGIGTCIYFAFSVKYTFLNFDAMANKAIFDDIGAGFMIISHNHEILYTNGVAREMVEEVISEGGDIATVIEEIIERKEYQMNRNGSNYKVVANRIYTRGRLKGYSILITDITDIVQLERRAEQNSLASARLLANISHELRTPLNAITGAAKLLEEQDVSKENYTNLVNVINMGAESLTEMISDFVEVSSDNNIPGSITNAPYNVCTLISNVAEMCGKRVARKQIKFSLSFASDVPTRAKGDDKKIRQIITTILSNAIKYTDEGSIKLRVSGEYRKDGLYEYEYLMTDMGSNPFEKDTFISQTFSGENNELFNFTSGYEISLYVVRRLVSDLGGTISIRTLNGRGCAFSVKIPQEIMDRRTLQDRGFATKMEIVLCGNDNVLANDIMGACQEYGIIAEKISGIQSLRKKVDDDHLYHILAYDYETFDKKVQASEKASNYIKVAILDAGKTPKTYDNNVIYVNKPISILTIRRILLHLEERDNDGSLESRFTAPSAKILVVDDNSLNLQMAYTMLEQFKVSVDVANSGYECLRLINAGNKYDMILMDYMMEGLDGLETTAKIRAMDDEISYVPIIAFTANSVHGAAEKYLNGGMDDCIFKPATLYDFESALRRFLPENMLIYDNSNVIPEDIDIFPEIEGIDSKVATKYMGNNLEMFKDMLVSFALDIMDRESLILSSWQEGDIKNFVIHVHGVKGTARNLGMTELSCKMEALEHAGKEQNLEYIKTNLAEDLSYYRRFTKILMPYVEEKEKKRASYNVSGEVGQVLLKMNELLEDFEISAAEKLFYTIWPGQYDEVLGPLMLKLKESIEHIDYYESLEYVEQLLAAYTNKED